MKTWKHYSFFSVLVIFAICTILLGSGLMSCLSTGTNKSETINSTGRINTTTGRVNANELARFRSIYNEDAKKLVSENGRTTVESIEVAFQPKEITRLYDLKRELASLVLITAEWGRPRYYKIKAVYTGFDDKTEEVHLRDFNGGSADIDCYRVVFPTLPEINNEATFFLIATPFSNGYQVIIRFVRFANDVAILSAPNTPEDFEVVQMNDGNIAITGYKGTRRNVVIPETLYGQKVTLIRNRAFNNKNIFSVKIPDTVTEIEGSFTIQDSYDIRYAESFPRATGAFGNNKLITVELGNGLRIIGDTAFGGNVWLNRIQIPDSVSRIGKGAFAYCDLIEIKFGNGLREIDDHAFRNNDLTSLIIPDWVTKIGIDAFSYNINLATVVLPSSLRNNRGHLGAAVFGIQVVYGVFDSCPINKITLPENIGTAWLIFDENLSNYYESQGKRAGTYIKNGPVWTRINS